MESKPTPLAYIEDWAPRLLWGLFPDGIIPIREEEPTGDPPRYTIDPSRLEPEQTQGLAVMLKVRFPESYSTLEAAIDAVKADGYELLVCHCKGMSLDGGATIWPPLQTFTFEVGTLVKDDL